MPDSSSSQQKRQENFQSYISIQIKAMKTEDHKTVAIAFWHIKSTICAAACNFQSKFVWFISKQMVHMIAHNKLQQLERQLHFESDSAAELQMGL